MDSQDVERLGIAASSEEAAIAWIECATRLVGPKFDPQIEFRRYAGSSYMGRPVYLSEELIEAISKARMAAVGLLGTRAADMAYRTAVEMLADLDSGWRRWARPASQGGPRWWLVDRPGLEATASSPDPLRGLAFEDGRGIWWIWDPTTEKLHNDTPWLFRDFYHRAAARRREVVDDGWGAVMFSPVSVREARALVISGALDGPGADLTTRRLGSGDGLQMAGTNVIQLPSNRLRFMA
jgi:hypothetical protein